VYGLIVSDYVGEFATITYTEGDGEEYETIVCTAGHACWAVKGENLADRPGVSELPMSASEMTPSGRWVDAKWLRVGDVFLTRSGRSATVAGLTIRTERLRVYNLHVRGTHTYAVGDDGVLVHNYCNGVHHRWMRALGNPVRMGSRYVTRHDHREVHDALRKFLLPLQMFPKKGRPGVTILEEFGVPRILDALDEFYQQYRNGEYYFDFIQETFRFRCQGL